VVKDEVSFWFIFLSFFFHFCFISVHFISFCFGSQSAVEMKYAAIFSRSERWSKTMHSEALCDKYVTPPLTTVPTV
jgi:hypothetical protein